MPSSTRLRHFVYAAELFAAFIAAPAVGRSDEPAPKPVRVDRFGDPLPDGALMRLGTVGFRLPNMAGVGFRPTGELVALTGDLKLHVWPVDGTTKPSVTALTNEKQIANRLALAPNARFVAAHMKRKIVVWDISGKAPAEYLVREMGDAYKLCFSAAGKLLAVNETTRGAEAVLLCDLTAKTWDKLPCQAHHVQSLSFTPDGKWLTVLNGDIVTVIDSEKRKERFQTKIEKASPEFAALSPDGTILAIQPIEFVHGPKPALQMLAVPSGKPAAGNKPPPGSTRWVGFTPDGLNILLGGPHGIREWDPFKGMMVREIAGPTEYPAVYSADGRRLAAYGDNAILLWDVAKRQHVRPEFVDAGHSGTVANVTVSPDGKLIVTSGIDRELRAWSADTGRPLYRVRALWSYERPLVFLPDSKSFIALAEDYVTPVLHDAASGKELRRFVVQPEFAKTQMTRDLRLSADGKTLITTAEPVIVGNKSHTVRWDVITGQEAERTEAAADSRMLEMGMGGYSPDGSWLVQYGKISRVGRNESVQLIPAMESVSYTAPRFSHDLRFVAITRTPRTGTNIDWDRGSVVVFDLTAMTKVAELSTGHALRHAFSKDGRQLAVAGWEEIVIWDIVSGKPVRRLGGGSGISRTWAVTFTPDGRRLITGHDDCTALVWDLAGAGRPAAQALSAGDLARAWETLAGVDAARAYAAGWELSDRPGQAVALLRERLKPARAADGTTVRRLVESLGTPAFADREAAEKGLRELGDSAIPDLRAALKSGLSAEQKGRVERLLAEADAAAVLPGERQRQVRAVAVLERAGTDDARRLLAELAAGLPEARLTREAAEALRRLKR